MIVACELVTRDRQSFDDWWPLHLAEVLELADRLYLRVDPDTSGLVLATLHRFLAENDHLCEAVTVDPQFTEYGRWQEDAERQALLEWAHGQQADWCAVFDADEVIEPGGGRALRSLLESPRAGGFRVLAVQLNYISHHRPGHVLPRAGIDPPRIFRLDDYAAACRYVSDSDGLHCGSVPWPTIAAVKAPDLRVVHYHATTPAEYMGERSFYDNTVEVARWGGIDWLYRCDRFGDEHQAVPLEELFDRRDERLGRIAAGVGLTA
jgi:hypothetical protein